MEEAHCHSFFLPVLGPGLWDFQIGVLEQVYCGKFTGLTRLLETFDIKSWSLMVKSTESLGAPQTLHTRL